MRRRALDHVEADLYWEWHTLLATASQRQYATDVARFLRDHPGTPLAHITVEAIDRYRQSLPKSTRARMTTALAHFFQFALEKGVVQCNPVERIKYRRAAHVHDRQLDFFDLLLQEGVARKEIGTLIWADFVGPAIDSEAATLRIAGRAIKLRDDTWKALQQRFRRVVRKDDLRAVLRRKIAS